MSENDEFIGRIEDYLVEFDGATPLPVRVRDAIHAELPRIRQVRARPVFLTMPAMRPTIPSRSPWGIAAVATLGVTVVAVVAVSIFGLALLQQPSVGPAASPSPTATLGTLEPVASPIACRNTDLSGTLLGCSMDGNRLLIQQGLEGTLFVLDADGSETRVSEALPPLDGFGMSARPSGATISPDGSRVVFAGVTKSGALDCHNGALFGVDAAGGPADVLWRSQAAGDGGIVRDPVFSPDGTQIAFADGYCDNNHSVWVMSADGSDAHQIVTPDGTPLGGGWVRGLAWSPAGDRLALQYQGMDPGFEGVHLYTFATDGSGFTKGGDASEFCWPGRRCPVLRQPAVDPAASPSPTATLGTAEPVAGPIDCVDPEREVQLRVPVGDGHVDEAGTVLGCSRDGTRLLVQKGLDENLFVVRADGSETQLTESGLDYGAGSARPRGATISPDGSRVIFAGLTRRESSCHYGALFAVDADGGPTELLWESHVPQNGIVRYPTFSPDGTQIAFADGYCDSDHSVWVMNADGSQAHQIATPDGIPLGGTHVHGLAWSPAGDRIAIAVDQGNYTFAIDGSDFKMRADDPSQYCWPGLRC